MCEHAECQHSLGPGSHCPACDRAETLLTAKPLRECHRQLQAVSITDPKELMRHFSKAVQQMPLELQVELYRALRELRRV